MPDKLTDNEIIKALELEATPMERNCVHARYEEACGMWCEKKHKWAENCMECKEHAMGYYGRYAKATLDLINRLQAENDTLRTCVEQIPLIRKDGKSPLSLLTAEIKAEAYKEFAERLCEDRVSNDPVVIAAKCVLKELVGEDK